MAEGKGSHRVPGVAKTQLPLPGESYGAFTALAAGKARWFVPHATRAPGLSKGSKGDPLAVVVLAQVTVLQVWEGRWRVIPYDVLPDWLKDNDYLLHGHRPPMPSFRACFKSIFRIHTETGNIWTHLLGDCGSSGAAWCFHGAGAIWGGLWGAGWRAGQPHQALGLAPCSLCARNLWFRLTYPCWSCARRL